jgi:hypothetical protein
MTQPPDHDDALFPVVTVNCFFACGQRIVGADPQVAHRDMEAHYQVAHADDITRVTAQLDPRSTRRYGR